MNQKKKEEMGGILAQAMNMKDDQIQRPGTKELPAPNPPQPQNALQYHQPPAVQNKENVTDAIVPFNPIMDSNDQAVP